MTIQNLSAQKYLRQVRAMLPCSRKMKRLIVEKIQIEVMLYLEKVPDANYNALLSRFGKPEEIAVAYVENIEPSMLLKKLHIRKRVLLVVCIVLLFTVITWFATITWAIQSNRAMQNGYYVIEREK